MPRYEWVEFMCEDCSKSDMMDPADEKHLKDKLKKDGWLFEEEDPYTIICPKCRKKREKLEK